MSSPSSNTARLQTGRHLDDLVMRCDNGVAATDDNAAKSGITNGSMDPILHAHTARGSTPTPAPPGNAHWSNSSGSTLDDSPGPPAGCEPDAIKLFVGNIPKSCTEQQLLPLFQSVGHVVELAIMRDRDIMESKGSAFLWYSTRAAADMAIQKFHLRYILNDPVGENNRRLVLRKAWAKGDSQLIQPAAAQGGGGGREGVVGGGTVQMLYLSREANAAGQQQPAAAMQAKPHFTALSYQSQSPQDLWPRQPLAPAGPNQSQPNAPPLRTGPMYPTSSPLPLSPNLTMTSLLSSSSRALISQLPAATMSARCGSRPTSTTYPASLNTLTRATQLAPGGPCYADSAEQLGAAAYAAMALPPSQLSHRLDMLDVVQRGAGVHRPYSMDAVLGLSSLSDVRPQRNGHAPVALGQDHGPPGLPSDAPTVSKTLLLEVQQVHGIIEYLHTVQGMSGAEAVLTLPPAAAPSCFQLRLSGSQQQVQAAEVLVNSLLGTLGPY